MFCWPWALMMVMVEPTQKTNQLASFRMGG
jgi:hypothetical protein